MSTVAALYVDPRGVYADLAGVEAWGEERDARAYAGPHPVVAHPPCARWGRYWSGGPSAKVRRKLGDDGGCFAAALAAVRTWGGVLEHPEASHAWRAFGIAPPPRSGGWIRAGLSDEGWTCCVEQGHYGHAARKATWLYAVGCELPSLTWGPARVGVRLDRGFHSREERQRVRGPRLPADVLEGRLGKRERSATPLPFRDVLLAMARSVAPPNESAPADTLPTGARAAR